jgi:hypothetical protein
VLNAQEPDDVDVVHGQVVSTDIRIQLTPASLDGDDEELAPMFVKNVDEYIGEAELRLYE